MELNVIKRNESIEVNFEGTEKIYILNQEKIRDELNWCLSIDHKELVLDMSGIRFIDTTGFHLLIEMYQLYKNLDKKITLINLSDEVKELFELVKVNKLFPHDEVHNLSHVAA